MNIVYSKNWPLFFLFILSLGLHAQSKNISGTITDEEGMPIPGVTIAELNTDNGTVTDFDGNYLLALRTDNAKVKFSSIGFISQTIAVGGDSVYNLTLKEDLQQLSEVVVVGYGQVKRQDLTGSVSTVDTEPLEDIPANSIERVLQGRVAGLQISTPSQDPGAGATVRIRGGSSLRGSNSPLVVVDGFPLGDAGDLKQINPADIERVEVLKDASASAIYGSRGANGVIIITTKTAKAGKTEIRIQQQLTASHFTSEVNLWRDPVLLAQISNEGRRNGGFQPLYIGAENSTGVYYPSVAQLQSGEWPYFTKWDDLVFRSPFSNNTTFSVISGNDRTSFNLSGNYYTDNGVYIDDGYKKGGYNLRVKHEVYDNLTVRVSNILTKGKRNYNGGLAYYRNPIFPIYDENGDYYLIGTNDYSHPVAISENRLDKSKTIDVISSASIEWQAIPSLKFTQQLNYKYGASVQDQYYPDIYTEGGDFNNGAAYINNFEGNNFASSTYANFDKRLAKHSLSATAGFTYESYLSRTSSLGAFDFVNETLKNENLGAGNPELNQVSNGKVETELVSGIFRFNYSYNDRYLATFTSRVDGSSKFGANNKYAFFPSGALSWKAQEEEFIKALNVFDQLKFRASYGISGNQGISPYQTLSRYGVSKYYDNGSFVTAIGPGYEVGRTGQNGIEVLWGGIPNPDLKWETTSQLDLGLDASFLDEKLRFTFDYYDKHTSDLLRQRILTPSSGYDRILVNDGEISNKGIELTVDANVIHTDDFLFDATVVFSRNKNEVLDLGNTAQSGLNVDPNTGMQYEFFGNSLEAFRQFPNILAVGQPINTFYGYKTEGIIQTLQEGINAGLDEALAQPGEYKYVDINGDGIIDTNDQTIIGDPNPDFTLSTTFNLEYKNFDFSLFLNGVFGQDLLNTQAFNQPSNTPLRWTPDNPTNDYPSLRDGRQVKFSDWFIEDGSFLRVQNVTAGYTLQLPETIINSMRIYMNINNLYTFTNFDGYDPEVGTNGIYYGGYPRLSNWTFGVNLTF